MIIKNFLYGLIIGLGFIIPGVSGGVLATILGIYEIIIEKILNFNQDIKNNLLYISPLILGIISSIILFSKVILYLIDYHIEYISYVFIGLILGCIPYLALEIKNKTHKNISLKSFIIAFLFGLSLFILGEKIPSTLNTPSNFKMFVAGFIYAFGKIVPGVSGASLLMFIGVYEYFLKIIANPLSINISLIIHFIPFIISFLLSAFIILKLMNYLLKNYFQLTYSAIIGFVISSILFLIPHSFNLISLIIVILAFLISYEIST